MPRSPPRSKARRQRSPRRKQRPSPRKPRTTMRAPISKPRAQRSPNPKSACNGWRPRPRPSDRCCRWRHAIYGRRLSTTSRSTKVTRRRWAQLSATISTRRLMPRRRCTGRKSIPTAPIRRCRRAPNRWRNSSRRRRSLPAGWRRSAWSIARPAASCVIAQVRPAAGLARGRSVALGRLRGGGACADRRGAAAGAAQPVCRDRQRIGAARAPRSMKNARRSRPRARISQAPATPKRKRARANATSTARRRGCRRSPKRARG